MKDTPQPRPVPLPIDPGAVFAALCSGWRTYRASWVVSSTYAALFALLGILLVAAVTEVGMAPMAWVLAGGFMIVGPVMLVGFFGIARACRDGRRPGVSDVLHGFRGAPVGLAALSAVCIFIFLVWMADASILYGFMVGGAGFYWADLVPRTLQVLDFQVRAGVMGAVFALIVFPVSAYSMPLLIERRANLAVAVSASARAVFSSARANFLWAFLLAVTVIVSMAIPPALLVSLPVLAHASEALYRKVFPPVDGRA